jgi:hypothetical protein
MYDVRESRWWGPVVVIGSVSSFSGGAPLVQITCTKSTSLLIFDYFLI